MVRFIERHAAQVSEDLAAGRSATAACVRFSAQVESLVRSSLEQAGAVSGVAVLAQGSLARRELTPHADIDLLWIVEEDRDELHGMVERALYPLWDAGLVLGHAVRTPQEVGSAAREHHHTATALLEARYLAGDNALAEGTKRRYFTEVVPAIRPRLLVDKLEELLGRRARHGSSSMAEPHLKNGPGALRDLHSLLWLGLLHVGPGVTATQGGSLRRLLEAGLVYEREAALLRQVRELLLSFRCALHLVSGRAEERLLFQHQSEVARVLRLSAQPGETDTEALLRSYFQAARIGRLTVDEVVERMLQGELPATSSVRDLGGGFGAAADLIFARDPKAFATKPERMIDVVRMAHEEGLRLSPRARSSLHHALATLPGKLHDDERAARALRQLAASRHCRGEPFLQLLELGVLPLVLRDIERLSARFKQDGYHAYPTDEHLCRCVDMALRVSAGVEPPPEALRPALSRTTRFELLVLGALFHDLGKGLPGDHAKIGAEIAAREGKRMGLTAEEREVLTFLVEEHLVLSWASQRRDLSDPSVIEDIARRVQTVERLDLLALLTWVDIASVAPGMMTDWKGRLLGLATEQVRQFLLMPAQMNASRTQQAAEIRLRARATLEGIGSEALERFIDGASVRAIASRVDDELIADLAAFAQYDPGSGVPVAEAVLAEGGHAHMVRVVCEDRRGLLGDLARALSSHGANVLHAHVDAREDGIGFDAFRVDDGRGRALHPQVVADVLLALRAAVAGDGVLLSRAHRPWRGRGPRIAPRVRAVEGADSWGATIVEVRTEDRPGLVADLAHTMSAHGWQIALAKISTDGAVVRDTFYVQHDTASVDAAGDLAQLEAALHACLRAEDG